jgi:hypothetical protein
MSHANAARVLDNLIERLGDLPEPDRTGARDTLMLTAIENTPCSCLGQSDHWLTLMEKRRATYLELMSKGEKVESEWVAVFRLVLIQFLDTEGDRLTICGNCGKFFLRLPKLAKGKPSLQVCCSRECSWKFQRLKRMALWDRTIRSRYRREYYQKYLLSPSRASPFQR